jgi:hypothetical protein
MIFTYNELKELYAELLYELNDESNECAKAVHNMIFGPNHLNWELWAFKNVAEAKQTILPMLQVFNQV